MEDLKLIENAVRDVVDFPKEGIVFKDITTLLNDKVAYTTLMNHLVDRYKNYNLDFIAGIEARGFIFGAALAAMLGVGFVPIRK
ncbi:MAG: adenine phosphoribosyltransferase, partial [Sulfurimonas sp.]